MLGFTDRTQGDGDTRGQPVKSFIPRLPAVILTADHGRLGEFLFQHKRLRQMLLEFFETFTTDGPAIADNRWLADADAIGEALDTDIDDSGGIAQDLLANFQIDALFMRGPVTNSGEDVVQYSHARRCSKITLFYNTGLFARRMAASPKRRIYR